MSLSIDTISSLPTLSERESMQVNKMLTEERKKLDSIIIVLDDDPTGTQTVHGVNVYTDWDEATLRRAFLENKNIFYILTNSRSFSEKDTIDVHTKIGKRISEISAELERPFLLVSRGDSTLRGHFPTETEALKKAIEEDSDNKISGEIICPFFFEGKRFTFNNIHYLKQNSTFIPVGETEFSKDATFGFKSSNLIDYVIEKSHKKINRRDIISIPIEMLRNIEIDNIVDILLTCSEFQKIIINALNYTDLKVFAIAFFRAMKKGKSFIVRSAASLPKVLAGIEDIPYLKIQDVKDEETSKGGLVIVGSHVNLTNKQLANLMSADLNINFQEFNINAYDYQRSFREEIGRVLKLTEYQMNKGTTTVIYTSRELKLPSNMNKEKKLAISVSISEALTQIVSELVIVPKYVVAKGGITSSDVATKGLKIKKGFVLGQISAGIPVWRTDSDSKFPNMPYIIFPGNVGSEYTLKEIIQELEN